MTEEIRCDWCNKPGHGDCSPRMTLDELVANVSADPEMIRRLVVKACGDDEALAYEYGGVAAWKPKERGYALYWQDLQEQKEEEQKTINEDRIAKGLAPLPPAMQKQALAKALTKAVGALTVVTKADLTHMSLNYDGTVTPGFNILEEEQP